MTEELLQGLEDAVLNFKYWIDEPGVDIHLPCYFTENHQVLFHSIEYLAGQLYRDRIFTNNGENGEWHREHGRTYLKRWLTWRKRFGFSEWLSNGYYAEDMLGLLILSQLAEEEEIRSQAKGLIELLFFDIARTFPERKFLCDKRKNVQCSYYESGFLFCECDGGGAVGKGLCGRRAGACGDPSGGL